MRGNYAGIMLGAFSSVFPAFSSAFCKREEGLVDRECHCIAMMESVRAQLVPRCCSGSHFVSSGRNEYKEGYSFFYLSLITVL
jgi:hypothetical protein